MKKKKKKNIKKEVDEKYNSYIREYSQGYTKEQLEEEYEKTIESMLVMKCESEKLERESDSYNPDTNTRQIAVSVFVWTVLSIILNIPSLTVFSKLFNISCIIYITIDMIKLKKSKEKFMKSVSMNKEAIYLELKSYAIEKCIIDYDPF